MARRNVSPGDMGGGWTGESNLGREHARTCCRARRRAHSSCRSVRSRLRRSVTPSCSAAAADAAAAASRSRSASAFGTICARGRVSAGPWLDGRGVTLGRGRRAHCLRRAPRAAAARRSLGTVLGRCRPVGRPGRLRLPPLRAGPEGCPCPPTPLRAPARVGTGCWSRQLVWRRGLRFARGVRCLATNVMWVT
jgi:hypothetical protein